MIEINKSEEIRQMLRANPKVTVREVADALKAKGIKASDKLFYLVKHKMLNAKKTSKIKATPTNAQVSDALATLLKIKHLANQVGGLKKLKALVDAMSL